MGMDVAIFSYPWYSVLGSRLSSGDIPMWNPHEFAGAPFAADPESGWTYLPAMLLFTLLPAPVAVQGYMFLHLMLAGLPTYALARTLGMRFSGALLAAVAYAYSSFLYRHNVCCFVYTGVYAWLPLMILGMELAVRTPAWHIRGLCLGMSGLAISQILAAWPGQGSYYALILLGGYTVYRTLLAPSCATSAAARLGALLLNGSAVLLFGLGLAAAGLLPRLEFFALSSLGRGYASHEMGVGGWSLGRWSEVLLPWFWYAGGTILVLAVVAPVLARGAFASPYFAAASLGALVLSGHGPTPLHSVLYLLPGFAGFHPHIPERVMMVFYLGPALLAGATLTCLGQVGKKAALLALLPAVAIFFLFNAGIAVKQATLLALIFGVGFLTLYPLLSRYRPLLFGLLLLVAFADLLVAGREAIARDEVIDTAESVHKVMKVDLDRYYQPSGAVRFLQSKQQQGELFRYFGYAPDIRGRPTAYTGRWPDPQATAVELPNRAMFSGLHDVQGYNPLHLARFDEYLLETNRRNQGYHDAQLFSHALVSPLMDLMNARYVIAPRTLDLKVSERAYPIVYRDRETKVLENRAALPRAWIVHAAQQVEPGEALRLISSSEVDPRDTALLQEPPPSLAQPNEPGSDQALITFYDADQIQVRTITAAPGLLVLSEVYYPAWKAYVDGQPAPLYLANYLFRAVPVPAGEHRVELRYESLSLQAGLMISLIACGAWLMLVVISAARYFKRVSR
jgi:membrane protein YfhO